MPVSPFCCLPEQARKNLSLHWYSPNLLLSLSFRFFAATAKSPVTEADEIKVSAQTPEAPDGNRPTDQKPAGSPLRLVIVTGLAGSGRSTALRHLEDIGFETIDNLPLPYVAEMIPDPARPGLAIGIDTRTRGYDTKQMIELIQDLRELPEQELTVIYLDCDDATLIRRFSETRRRHPEAQTDSIEAGLWREREHMEQLRDHADIVIDTSNLSPGDLRRRLLAQFGDGGGMALTLTSFSYKRGAPAEADLVFDCRFLRNPHYVPDLRPLDGRDQRVAAYINEDPLAHEFFVQMGNLLKLLLPAYVAEGKSYLNIAIGCTGGQHRSVAVTERLGAWLRANGWRLSIRHRELGSDSNSMDQRATDSEGPT